MKNTIKKMFLLVTAIAVLLLIVIAVYFGYQIHKENVWYDLNAKRIGKEFGFSHGSPYFRFGTENSETFTFEDIDPNGFIGKAGVISGDIVYTDFQGLTTAGLYKFIDDNRGKTVTIEVADGGDGLPLAQRRKRKITLTIPKATLNLIAK